MQYVDEWSAPPTRPLFNSSLLGQNILLSTLILHSSLNVSDQVSQP